MQISELKEKYQTDKSIADTIEVKPYISFVEKKLLIIDILENCLKVDDNDLLNCDHFTKHLATDLKIITNYSNLDFGEESLVEYDFLCESGILDNIKDCINSSELEFIDKMINKEIEQRIKISNSVEGILASKLQQLISKIPSEKSIQKIIKDIPKSINKISPENLEILKGMFNKQGGQ